jgi:hypothetical protein
VKLFRLSCSEGNTGIRALSYGGHKYITNKRSEAGFIGDYLKIKF